MNNGDGASISFDNDLRAFIDMCHDCGKVAGRLGFRDMDSRHTCNDTANPVHRGPKGMRAIYCPAICTKC